MIDYYGTKDNYIHLKFGDCRKCYNFTDEFIKDNKEFAERYKDYWDNGASKLSSSLNKGFKSPFEVVEYAHKKKIPVNFYFNFTDTPAESYDEIIKYLGSENTYIAD